LEQNECFGLTEISAGEYWLDSEDTVGEGVLSGTVS
jgi:hypothetical protein